MPQKAKILEAIEETDGILISSHVPSDGDAIGSLLAFQQLCRRLKKSSIMMIDGEVPQCYRFLPHWKEIHSFNPDLLKDQDLNLAVCLDCGKMDRLERLSTWVVEKELPIINIDHHQANNHFGTINWVEPHTAAVGEMIFRVFQEAGIPIDRETAAPLYVAILTDTGGFSFSNTTWETHNIAGELIKLGLDPTAITRTLYRSKSLPLLKMEVMVADRIKFASANRVAWADVSQDMCNLAGVRHVDTPDLINIPFSLAGVRIAVLFRELEGGDSTKISLRSDGLVDVNQFALKFNGGGHTHAAGFTVSSPPGEACREVIALLAREIETDLSSEEEEHE